MKGLRNLGEIVPAADRVMAARGDLYTEVDLPHCIIDALRQVREAAGDKAVVGSRLLESLLKHPMPSCADVMDLGFLKELGYTRFLIGDDICLKREVLMRALRIFQALFRE